MLASNPYQFQSGSRERGKALTQIADTLNQLAKPTFKLDQRAVRDHIAKLLRSFNLKNKQEEKASGIDVETTECDVLCEEILELKKESELKEQNDQICKSKQIAEDQKSADSIRRKSLETWHQTRKRESCESENDLTPKRRRNNGNETLEFLREKSQNDVNIREQELAVKKEEIELQRLREDNANKRYEAMMLQAQQQNQALMMLLSKMANKLG